MLKVAICAIAKKENKYLKEWALHYKQLGFDNIILYDNNEKNGEKCIDVISDFVDSNFIIIEDVRGLKNQQIKCYNNCYKKYSKNYDWILYADIDEFLILNVNNNIKSYLSNEKFNSFNCIKISWRTILDNNIIFPKHNNYSIKRFTEVSLVYREQTKPILRTSINNIEINSPHGPLNNHDITKEFNFNNFKMIVACNADGEPCENNKIIENCTWNSAYINHYWFKSISEYYKYKMSRGYPTTYENSGKSFLNFNNFFCYNKLTFRKSLFCLFHSKNVYKSIKLIIKSLLHK